MVITNTSIRNMGHWVQHPIVRQYSLSPDWDDRWRCGGNLEEVIDESHLSGDWQKKAIHTFCNDKEKRMDIFKNQELCLYLQLVILKNKIFNLSSQQRGIVLFRSPD